MNRCPRAWRTHLSSLACGAMLMAATAGLAHAQNGVVSRMVTDSNGNSVTVRTFPATALRGTLQVVQPPEVLFNNLAGRLSPGARIRGANGMLMMSASLVGQSLPVMTVLDSQSMLHDVWVLNETEVALYPTKPSYSK
ncbi:hypothetical protein [Rhodoferax sp.]|uniref:hypothetical protein n=1 Tax=Rhodoferax sp. TaxID=50421 RepID=UPI0026001273|nr:hypothetical protein [Rhodoferax sp.]